jgi:hypothetical protein
MKAVKAVPFSVYESGTPNLFWYELGRFAARVPPFCRRRSCTFDTSTFEIVTSTFETSFVNISAASICIKTLLWSYHKSKSKAQKNKAVQRTFKDSDARFGNSDARFGDSNAQLGDSDARFGESD